MILDVNGGGGGNRETNIRTVEDVRMKHTLMGPHTRPDLCTLAAPPRGLIFLYYVPDLEAPENDDLDTVIGTVGLSFRDGLPWPDIGYAILGPFEGKGYAFEAANEVLKFWRERIGVKEVCAYTNEHNVRSHNLAKKLGLVRGGPIDIYFGHPPDERFVQGIAWILPEMKFVDGLVLRPTIGKA
jgi:RimJ/RimL family protein N-acetyltransferase